MTIVRLQKTGMRNFMFGVFSDHKKIDVGITFSGFIEACYNEDMGKELMKIALRGYWDEGLGFTIAVNHLLAYRAHVGTRMRRLARLDRGSLSDQLQQVKDLYITQGSEKEVNIDYGTRTRLNRHWTAIHNAQSVRSLLAAREEVARLVVNESLPRDLKKAKTVVSKKLAKTLALTSSPTDDKVMDRLRRMGPSLIQHQN